MPFLPDPDEMTPDQIVGELPAILAAAYLRIRQTDLTSVSTDKRLDVSRRSERPCGRG